MSLPARLRGRDAPPRLSPWLALLACVALQACGDAEQQERAGAPTPIVRTYGAGDASLTLTLDRDSLTIAEQLLARVEVEVPEDAEVGFPESPDRLGEFVVTRSSALPSRLLQDGRVLRGREYELQPFLPGDYELPALTVTLGEASEVATDPVPIQVLSVLDDPEAAELRDISGPMDMPAPWWWTAAGLAGLAGLAALLWWWKRRSKPGVAEVRIPAHERALAAVADLLAEDFLASGGFKPFYRRLSAVVRRYVEERFGLRAPEQTTEEFLASMASSSSVGSEHQALLRGFLGQADRVKFAEFVPSSGEAERAAEAAQRFIRQTAPDDGESGSEQHQRGAARAG